MGKKLKRGFYWRGGIIWVRADPVEGRPKSTGCRYAPAAELWRCERERLAASPRYAASLSATFGSWVLKMMAIKRETRSEGTVHMYGVKLGHFARVWGTDAPLATVTPEAVDAYITQRRAEGAANNTIARELSCLRQLLRHAKRARAFDGDLSEVMPIGFSADYVPVTRTLAPEDLPKLWAALRNDQERAFVALALGLAMDTGDIERARPEDFDRKRGVMLVRGTKNVSRAAEVPVLPHVRDLVVWAVKQLPISWPRASHGIGEACARAGLPHMSPKDLRRTAASWLVAAGADQRNVGRFLRHISDAMVRKVYGQMTAAQVGKLLESSAETLRSTTRPLGGIGRRRGFKKPTDGNVGTSPSSISRGYAARVGVSRRDASAESLHSVCALALALAAEAVGVCRA